jgi:bifunctional non-homologous end joining protein LigD
LKGNWAPIRMGSQSASKGKSNWLLIKEHDQYERGPGQPSVTEEESASAVTGRSLDEIVKQEDHVWQSKEGKKSSKMRSKATTGKKHDPVVEQDQEIEAKGLSLRLTHPDKQLDAESKLTKRQLADYYLAVADNMLPHVVDRPLSIVRCPEGTTKPCFFQKHRTTGLPAGIGGIEVRNKNGSTDTYITIATAEGLAGLAQMGVLELHPWGSRNESLETPDRLIFDLDPDASITWKVLAATAVEVRARLKKLGLESFLKSTGGKGLHVVAPIKPEHPWPVVKEFAHAFANRMADANPGLYLTKMTKSERRGRIFIDYLRNERGATAVAPYSPRARQGAPVAMPVAWSELKSEDHPRFQVAEFPRWKKRLRRDPWQRMLTTSQSLTNHALQEFGVETRLAG